MAKAARSRSSSSKKPPFKKALTPEGRENQMVALAIDLAEEQLRDGTASSQIITHYLKIGSSKERLEKEILEKNKELIQAKIESYQYHQEAKTVYAEALEAMKRYTGHFNSEDEDV